MAGNWFELSNDGWRRMNLGRPLGLLLREAIQNAFDEEVGRIEITIEPQRIVIEDDGERGFADERLVYTVFLTDKQDSPTVRGRKGRGLKELIAAAQSAVVESVGRTVTFDRDGRHVTDNERASGTCITLARRSSAREIDAALATLALTIPPPSVQLLLNRRPARPPRPLVSLEGCLLDTVVAQRGVERIVERETELTLYELRSPREQAHIFEMGLPVQAIRFPWHVDVAQRVPMSDGRDKVDETYRLTVLATILETLVDEVLPARNLKDDWVMEVLATGALSDEAIGAYARRAFSQHAVLSSSARADDRARQAGARIVDTRSMARGVVGALARVLETSEHYVKRQLADREVPVRAPDARQQRSVAVLEHLAQRILSRQVRVELIEKPADLDGWIEEASYDRERDTLRLNILGSVDFGDPLSPASLAVLFHELAHARVAEHDHRFIRELERVAARGARILADSGQRIRQQFGL